MNSVALAHRLPLPSPAASAQKRSPAPGAVPRSRFWIFHASREHALASQLLLEANTSQQERCAHCERPLGFAPFDRKSWRGKHGKAREPDRLLHAPLLFLFFSRKWPASRMFTRSFSACVARAATASVLRSPNF